MLSIILANSSNPRRGLENLLFIASPSKVQVTIGLVIGLLSWRVSLEPLIYGQFIRSKGKNRGLQLASEVLVFVCVGWWGEVVTLVRLKL